MGSFIVLVHLGVGALWLGAMAYSLRIVQPRVARLFADPERAEEVYREFATGNRWPVLGLIGTLAVSGVILVLLAPERDAWWWAVVAAKAVLLLAASVAFWWVSWRGWPARVFALPAELPALQGKFRRVAVTMAVLVATAFVLGVRLGHGD
jgi:Flp pilus assembly protein TadB